MELAQDVEALSELGDEVITQKANALLEKLQSLPENTDLTERGESIQAKRLNYVLSPPAIIPKSPMENAPPL